MRKPTRFGICGLAAWMCSFCLSTATGLPQDPATGEDSSLPPAAAPSLRDLQDQSVAILQSLERLGEDRDAALHRYTETITGQLNALKDAFALQRTQELQAARTSNRIILTVAAVSAGLAVLMMLFSAFFPIWALKRFAAIRTIPRAGSLSLAGHFNVWGGAQLPPLNNSSGGPAILPLSGAINHIEQRLLALEKRASQSKAGARDEATRRRDATAHISPALRKPESSIAKFSQAAHVAITLGAGEAIGFLPRETNLPRFHSIGRFFGKLKKLFHRS